MRKFLLSTIALMMSVAMMAAGAGNGTSKANAIDFDWADGHKPALSAGSWYRVDLTPLKQEANDPTLALYLTNLTDETASVTVNVEATVSVLGQTQSGTKKLNYSIKGKDYQLWSVKSFDAAGREWTLKQLMNFGLTEIYLQLTANKEIALSAKVYETEDIVDDACSKAVDFNWAGVSVPAGEKWFRMNLADVKAADKQLKFVVKNNGAAAANVAFDLSLDCPASAVIEKDWVIAAGAEKEDEFSRVFLDVLKEDWVYLKLTNNQPITLSVEEEVVVVDPDKYVGFDCAAAPELVFDEEIALNAGAHVCKVSREKLIAARGYKAEFYATNLTATAANLKVETAFACPVKSAVEQNLTIGANETVIKGIKGGMLDAVNSEWVYIRFTTDQALNITVGMRNTDPCAAATPFDWSVGATQEAGTTQWYEMDITSLKQNKQHLYLEFINHANALALVNVEVALDCQGVKVPLTLPVLGNMSVGQMFDYRFIARAPLNRIYVGVTTDSKIELAAATKDAIASDKTPCLNATDLEYGVSKIHNPGTEWYRFSLDMLNNAADVASFYLANQGNARANVTIGMVTDCQYTTSTTITLPLPTGLEIELVTPNILGKLLNDLAQFEEKYNKVATKDVYFEVTTDQPIKIALRVADITIDDPCASAVLFDWQDWEVNGIKLQDGEDKWYKVDVRYPLTKLKNGEDIVATVVNPSAVKNVNVHMAVSPTCPVLVDVQKDFTVPAKTTLTRVVSYEDVVEVLKQYVDKAEDKALLAKAQLYVVYTKMLNLAKQYGKYIPYAKVEALVDRYADNLTVTGVKDALVNYEKYIPVAELKQQLANLKDYVAYDLVVPMVEKYGEFIPYETALKILSQYDKVLPYANGAVDVLKKCTTYITIENFNKLIKRVMQYVPVEKFKALIDRIENRLANMGVYCYVHVVTDGELDLNPGLPLEPGCPDAPVEYTVAACGSYEWNGVVYTESGDYYDTTKMATCEEAAFLDWKQPIKLSEFTAPWYKIDVTEIIENESEFTLTFDNDLAETAELALEMHYYCSDDNDGFVLSATNEVAPGVYTRTMTYEEFDAYIGPDYETLYIHNVNADCDVVEVLHLTINEAVTVELTAEACDSYEWNDSIYTESGKYTYTTTGANGCDSTTILNLTINKSEVVEFTEVACDSYEWNGVTYTTSGDYTFNTTTAAGCERTEILHLTIKDCTVDPCYETTTVSVYVCDGAEFVDPITGKKHIISSLIASTLTWNDTVVTGLACDSIYTVVITPIVAPAALTEAILATIPGATPVLKAGQAVDVTGTVEAIKAYYEANDTEAIADVESVAWTAGAETVLAEDATTHTMTLQVVAGCDFVVPATLTFAVEPKAEEGMVGVVKRAVQMADCVVALTHEADGTAHLYKIVNGEAVAELSQNGIVVDAENAGEYLALSDIAATEDGKLVGVNYIMCQSGEGYVDAGFKRGETRFYIWNDLAADPALWFSSKMSSNWFRSKQGYTMALKGNSTNCQILLTGPHGLNGKARFSVYNIIEGQFVEPDVNNNDYYHFHNGASDINGVDMTTVLGTNYELNASPLANGNWILDGNLVEPYEVIVPEKNNVALTNGAALSADLGKKFNGASYLTVGTRKVVVAPYAVDGKLVGVKALDITTGLDATAELAVANLTAPVEATAAATAVSVAGNVLTVTLVADKTIYVLVLNLPAKEEHHATITDFACDASEYIDPITGEAHVISSMIAESQTWTSVKTVSANVDSIYTFVITPVVAPMIITEAVLKNISGALPTLVAGQAVDVTGTVDAIKAYYDALDTETIADVDSIAWTGGADGVIPCGAKEYTLILTVVAGCDFKVSTAVTLPVAGGSVVELTAEACDSYEWHGKTYTETGVYEYEENCNKEILNLTINKSVTVELTAVACDSYEWNDSTYTESGKYLYTTTGANGCDSTTVLNLTINKSEVVEFTEVACDSYEWNGATYTISGDYTFNTTTAAGCDRTEILHLTINYSDTLEFTEVACDSYEWNGTTYTASGVYTFNTTTDQGCDRTEILNLTINVSTSGTEERVVCPGESTEWEGDFYDKAGSYTKTLTNAAGCDSVATLVVTIQDPDNNITYDNVAAVSKYGNRLLLFNLNAFEAQYGWKPAESEVTWFKMNGEMDAAYDALNGAGDDVKVGTGFYYTEDDGAVVAGQYYALVEHMVAGDECESIWRTVVLATAPTQNAPQLVPTIANPNADLRILNLNPSSVTEVRVFNTSGEVIATYTADQASEFMFKAAQMPGYYMVEVMSNGEQTTLRYIVK